MAEFRTLREVLAEIRKQGFSITATHVAKFGTVTVSPEEFPDESVHPFSGRGGASERADTIQISSARLAEALEQHPNVFDVAKVFDGEDCAFTSLNTQLLHGSVYEAKVHIPKRLQKFQEMDCAEHFSVLFSGTYFAAITKFDGTSVWSNSAHEFREIFRSQIAAKTSLKAPLVGPSPVHTDLILVAVSPAGESNTAIIRPAYRFGSNNVVIVVDTPVQDALMLVFWECLRYLTAFYELALLRMRLIYIDIEIQNRMSELVAAHNDLANTSFWKFRRHLRNLSLLREQLGAVYELRVSHSREVSAYARHRDNFLDELKYARILVRLRGAFAKSTVMDVEVPDSLLPSLQFFQQQADSRRGTYSLLVASLIGALIGGIMTATATLLSSKH
jgi:hypothetical protein